MSITSPPRITAETAIAALCDFLRTGMFPLPTDAETRLRLATTLHDVVEEEADTLILAQRLFDVRSELGCDGLLCIRCYEPLKVCADAPAWRCPDCDIYDLPLLEFLDQQEAALRHLTATEELRAAARVILARVPSDLVAQVRPDSPEQARINELMAAAWAAPVVSEGE